MNDKNVTKLVRAMRKGLLRDHAVDVPYAALRAAYLCAVGENPHAIKGRQPSRSAATSARASEAGQHVALPNDWVVKKLYLAHDDSGCLERLALDPDGKYCVKDDWGFNAEVLLISAKVPHISKYGLPDYLQNSGAFFNRFEGLTVRTGNRVFIRDLGDDSGDSATLLVAMPLYSWQALLVNGTAQPTSLADEAEEWAGLHYKASLAGYSFERCAEFCSRYLEQQLECDANARFEWVWPDEDSDNRTCWIDLATGVLTTFGEAIPADVSKLNRLRVCLYEDDMYDVVPVFNEDGTSWRLTDKALRAAKREILRG